MAGSDSGEVVVDWIPGWAHADKMRASTSRIRAGFMRLRRLDGRLGSGLSAVSWASGISPAEADSPVVGVAVDLVAAFVDDYLVVEPAEGYQVVGVGGSAL
ncbi:MAG: hypothetical protein ACRDX9_00775 [Acidimicrobiia bacterium]